MYDDNLIRKDQVREIFDDVWKELVRYPDTKVCKHYAALSVVSAMEKLGINYDMPSEIVKAIACADDEKSLSWDRRGS